MGKWTGFSETEKLLMMGNIFEVSVDYLLKDNVEPESDNEEGFYVSKEMAEGYLLHERKTSKYVAFGVSLLILATIPYFLFKQDPANYIIPVIIIAVIGVGGVVTGIILEEDRYKILKKEALLFDHNYLKELAARYENSKKRYAAVMIVAVCSIAAGGIPFLLERKNITSGDFVTYYPVCIPFIAIGVYILIRTVPILEAYKLLTQNEEYTNKLSFKLKRKMRKKVDEF